ncbi:MAG: 4Fe-4S binding protein [Candidatus Riflebacteria bacterium]|nr:4Fe-4S binding protein [Candidatus Riflebacteria bacterium]
MYRIKCPEIFRQLPTSWGLNLIKTLFLIGMLLIAVQGYSLEEGRFPRPEFSTGYKIPSPTQPLEAFERNPYIATGLLAIFLGLTGHSLFVARSRTRLRILGLFSLVWFGFVYKGCICPVGSIQNIFLGMVDCSWPVSPHVVGAFFLPLIAALFFGRLFCGAACPFGVVQDLLAWKPVKVNSTLDRCLRIVPFVYLGLAVFFATCDLGFIICRYDPFIPFFRLSGSFSVVVFGAFLLILSVFIARPFCRYLCPYSVLLAACSLLTSRKVKVCSDRCVNCQLCRGACPVDAIIPGVNTISPDAFPEPREKAISRLKWLLALSPVLIAIGFYSGLRISEPVSRFHPQISVYNKITAHLVQDDDVVAFLINDGNLDLLRKSSLEAMSKIKHAGGIFGIYMSLVFIGAVFAATRRKSNTLHTVEPWNCVSCGRCYEWCPRNRVKVS